MEPDLHTKTVLTVIATMLTLLACTVAGCSHTKAPAELVEAISDGLDANPDRLTISGTDFFSFTGTAECRGSTYSIRVEHVPKSSDPSRYIIKIEKQGASVSDRQVHTVRPRKGSSQFGFDENGYLFSGVGTDGVEIWVFGLHKG
jgi:hypothetical protein